MVSGKGSLEPVMFGGAYRGASAVVTGHTGFKGAWLSLWLLRLGARVTGYALGPPTRPSLFEACGLSRHLEHVEDDIRDGARFSSVLRSTRPDFVFHLAAQPLVLDSYQAPLETFSVNVMGTLSVLESIRAAGRACTAIMVSSDKCYQERAGDEGYGESDPLGGHDPYSASKAAMEMAVAAYGRSFFPPERVQVHGVRLAVVRAGNVIGGGDWAAQRIVPDAFRAFAQGKPLAVRHPGAARPWQHVLEPLSGYLWLAARMSLAGGERLAGSWNFGPLAESSVTVAELVDSLKAAWGSGSWHRAAVAEARHEAALLKLCIDKARAQLCWEPVWGLPTAITRTVAWYRSFLADPADREGLFAACSADIRAYEQDAAANLLSWTR